MPTLDAVMVGKIHSFGPSEELSAIRKHRVDGPIRINENGIEGDEHAYRGHGGPDKVALHYAFDHYPVWAATIPAAAEHFATAGVFGENFSSTGMTEQTVCIGDRYRIGGAILEVCGPRQPCGKLAYRVGEAEVPGIMQRDATTGWFYRAIQAGLVESGNHIELLDRPLPEWTVARIIHGLYERPLDEDFLHAIHDMEKLATELRRVAEKRLESGVVEDWSGRMAMLT